jgi:hypothetical protein
MENKDKQRLEQLVRQGLVPTSKLPMLMQAMSNLQMGKTLKPTERDVLAKYMHNMTDIMLKDTTVFNRAKLHTQKTKYQTEETTVDTIDERALVGVKIVDGPEEEERERKTAENRVKRLSIRKRDKYRLLSKELKREKQKAGVDESVLEINTHYQTIFEAALECYGVSNIRDLPEDKKAEFFEVMDEAMKPEVEESNGDYDGLDETITPQHLKMAKGIAFDKRYKGTNYSGAEKAMEKVKKGLSSHPDSVKHLKHANESYSKESVDDISSNMAEDDEKQSYKDKFDAMLEATGKSLSQMTDEEKKEFFAKVDASHDAKNESFEDNEKRRAKARADMKDGKYDKAGNKVKLRGFGPDSSKGNMSNPSARAALMKKEEVEQVEEASETSIDAYYAKRHDNITKKFSASHQALLKKHTAGAAALDKRKKERGTGTVDHKTGKVSYANEQNEKVELTFEEMTPAQKAARIQVIAKASARVKSGDAAIDAEKRAKKAATADMKKPGARKGMAPVKRANGTDRKKLLTTPDNHDVYEDIQQLRKAITEGTTLEKVAAYKELNKLIQEKLKGEEFILEEDDLFVVIDEEITTGYSPDMGHSGTQGTVNLGGKEHNARKVPIKHYDEFKKKHPGSKVMFRGPRDGMGKEMHTRKSNAHHFYIVHKAKMKEEVELNQIIEQ